jgi:hypothetical protein
MNSRHIYNSESCYMTCEDRRWMWNKTSPANAFQFDQTEKHRHLAAQAEISDEYSPGAMSGPFDVALLTTV